MRGLGSTHSLHPSISLCLFRSLYLSLSPFRKIHNFEYFCMNVRMRVQFTCLINDVSLFCHCIFKIVCVLSFAKHFSTLCIKFAFINRVLRFIFRVVKLFLNILYFFLVSSSCSLCFCVNLVVSCHKYTFEKRHLREISRNRNNFQVLESCIIRRLGHSVFLSDSYFFLLLWFNVYISVFIKMNIGKRATEIWHWPIDSSCDFLFVSRSMKDFAVLL